MINLYNKRIILGVTGGIAAYKSAELCRLLVKHGAEVRVVMTPSAQNFITPLTMQALSGQAVHDQLLDAQAERAMGHIALARWADAIIVAPATANFLAKLAHGNADDLLSTLVLATQAPIGLAPAMNQAMWHAAATQANVAQLAERGYTLLGPETGEQACGDEGLGRMLSPELIATAVGQWFTRGQLAGKRVLMTAGPTIEAIDPVRIISNRSSGKMGNALAQAVLEAGAKVTMVTGPVAIDYPERATVVPVESAQQMHHAVMEKIQDCDLFIACAAVADYRVATVAPQKLKKMAGSPELKFVKNPDILADVCALSAPPVTVGFAAETEQVLEYGRIKFQQKGCDFLVINDISQPDRGIAHDDNAVTVLTREGAIEFALAKKGQIARQLIDLIATRSFHEKCAT